MIAANVDGEPIECAVCGKEIASSAWAPGGSSSTCSDECRAKFEGITGDRTSDGWLLERAADSTTCGVCARPLEDWDRIPRLFCTKSCKSRARKRGIDAANLMRIREWAFEGKRKS